MTGFGGWGFGEWGRGDGWRYGGWLRSGFKIPAFAGMTEWGRE